MEKFLDMYFGEISRVFFFKVEVILYIYERENKNLVVEDINRRIMGFVDYMYYFNCKW